jgi:hypothetical protein
VKDVWACRCGSGRCLGTIPSSFFDLPPSIRLEYFPLLDDWFVRVHESQVVALGEAGAALVRRVLMEKTYGR